MIRYLRGCCADYPATRRTPSGEIDVQTDTWVFLIPCLEGEEPRNRGTKEPQAQMMAGDIVFRSGQAHSCYALSNARNRIHPPSWDPVVELHPDIPLGALIGSTELHNLDHSVHHGALCRAGAQI